MKRLLNNIIALVMALTTVGCGSWLDIVPDNVATLDNAFALRTTAERYLFTCYSYLPNDATFQSATTLAAGDEFWLPAARSENGWQIAKGFQRVINPYMNHWQGSNGGVDLYEGIRCCNIFLENIDKVPDMQEYEKLRWAAEAKFLKAFYHFYLVRLYGPICVIRENLPVDAPVEKSHPHRSTIDQCFEYINELIDEAIPYLPEIIENEATEAGRFTKIGAYCFKALVAINAASPFYNGNTDYAGMTNILGEEMFNQEYDPQKWVDAAEACRIAIEAAHEQKYELYHFRPNFFQYDLSDEIQTQMDIRNSLCDPWNSEAMWVLPGRMVSGLQQGGTPRGLDPQFSSQTGTQGYIAPTMKIAEMFYSKNGVPIEEDVTYDYANRWGTSKGDEAHKYYIKKDYETSNLHFNREPRFYANIGFDGGLWYGQGKLDDDGDLLYIEAKKGQACAPINLSTYSVTGYWAKKYVNYENIISSSAYTIKKYPWSIMRLSDLYLLYAEALNESKDAPDDDVYYWIDQVRARAGLPSVKDAWENYSNNPQKYKSKEGMREIIHRERLIELCFEGVRFYDLRRWKKAMTEFNKPIIGWDIDQEDAPSYYRQKVLYNPSFSQRDYLWPISEAELLVNKNIKQNPGW